MRSLALLLVPPLLLIPASPGASQPADDRPDIQWNDNEVPAGSLENGRLELALEVREGDWYPLGEEEGSLPRLALAEEGKQPQVPGPMVRVPEGTEVRATVANPLEVPVEVQGLASRYDPDLDRGRLPPGAPLPWVRIAPGDEEQFRFTADEPGTYFYHARVPEEARPDSGELDDLLAGALIVDPPGEGPGEHEKVMVIQGSGVLTMNGRPWPYTERLSYDLGDDVTYRVINASQIGHPMHLHGFFFTVESRGDLAQDTVYGPTRRRRAVTEVVEPHGSLKLSWSADRPGGWMFHCHIGIDFAPNREMSRIAENPGSLTQVIRRGLRMNDPDPDEHAEEGMGGMVMGIYVHPPEGWSPAEPEGEPIRLHIREDSIPGNLGPRFGAALGEPGEEPSTDEVPFPGQPLVLHEGDPAPVRVVNETDEPTSIHWHGLEIESFYDGVPGVTGYRERRSPAVLPRDSFDVQLRTDRPGTYIYHTHISDIRQQGGGLYGPLLVMPEGEEWDPATDRIYIVGNGFGDQQPFRNMTHLNGTTEPDPAEMTVGTTYRLRLINIAVAGPRTFRLARQGFPVQWRPLEQDAWRLPPHQRRLTVARKTLRVGETYDVTFTPREAGELALQIGGPGSQVVEQLIRVQEAQDEEEASQ